MNFDGTTDDALGQRVVVFKIVHRVLRVLCVSVSSVFKQTRRLRSCMTSSRAVGRCVRHRGHRDTEDTEEFRDFASTTLPTTDGRICCLAITAGAPRSARGLFVYTLSRTHRERPRARRNSFCRAAEVIATTAGCVGRRRTAIAQNRSATPPVLPVPSTPTSP